MRPGLGVGLAALAVLTFVGRSGLGADDNPKFSIEEVMEKAHDKESGLLGKVTGGKASDTEKKELLELYTALSKNKPPKGPEQSWKDKTTALVTAAKSVAEGKKDAVRQLTTAANCKACHMAHRP